MKYGRLRQSIISKSLRDIKEEGFLFFLKKTSRFFYHGCLKKRANKIVADLRKKPQEYFIFQGKKLPYLIHPYNLSWINERSVEIPIVLDYIKESNPKKILEVGNVLKHYIKADWKVVDKFEKGEGIINEDIVDFSPKEKYDIIVIISTLEHIGFDDENNKEKILKAIENMKKCLNNRGGIIATMPLGYNKYMDDLIFSGKIGFEKMYFMKRISRKNKWREVSMEEARKARYNYPYNNANVVFIGVAEK